MQLEAAKLGEIYLSESLSLNWGSSLYPLSGELAVGRPGARFAGCLETTQGGDSCFFTTEVSLELPSPRGSHHDRDWVQSGYQNRAVEQGETHFGKRA